MTRPLEPTCYKKYSTSDGIWLNWSNNCLARTAFYIQDPAHHRSLSHGLTSNPALRQWTEEHQKFKVLDSGGILVHDQNPLPPKKYHKRVDGSQKISVL